MRIFAALGLSALLGLLSFEVRAAGLPVVISATVDYTHNTLTISGQNFGSSPSVTLDALAFPTQIGASTGTQIVANFPSGKAPSSFTPGTYFLTVTFKNQLPTIFGVDIGANGAAGTAGPAGAPGVAGATGPAGPQGVPGPFGPVGATGATGAAGATGAQGVAGPAGLQGVPGAVGPQGVAGANGTNGTGAPICASSDRVVSYQGMLVCKSTLPRYVDNGDGTVTDYKTGLMWEQTIASSDPLCANATQSLNDTRCVQNLYVYSINPPYADQSGPLFTDFLFHLNGTFGGSSFGQQSQCFASYCDWRIPTIGELRSLLLQELLVFGSNCVLGDPCIDLIFGPTQTENRYWSTTPLTSGDNFCVWFAGGGIYGSENGNRSSLPARAVRSVW